jgi:hypothetical protein
VTDRKEAKTIAEKIFDAHLVDRPAEDRAVLKLDAVFCHEITTPAAIRDLESRGKDGVYDPARIKVVIDHVSPAKDGKTALQGKILRDWARRHGIKDVTLSFLKRDLCFREPPSSWATPTPALTALSEPLPPALGRRIWQSPS